MTDQLSEAAVATITALRAELPLSLQWIDQIGDIALLAPGTGGGLVAVFPCGCSRLIELEELHDRVDY
jgi:hypothetical protein